MLHDRMQLLKEQETGLDGPEGPFQSYVLLFICLALGTLPQ